MRCIFCKLDSTSSTSIEHIIPESFGNRRHTLPKGVVCDKCNNYFSREVEKPFLESPSVLSLRFMQSIPSKKGVVPSITGVIFPNIKMQMTDTPKEIEIAVLEGDISELVQGNRSFEAYFLTGDVVAEDKVLSRFVAKIAIEVLALKYLKFGFDLSEMIDMPELDLIRDHARIGRTNEWPIHSRRIYDQNKIWKQDIEEPYQLLHEFDLLYTPQKELYLVLALFGVELVMNFGGPILDGYQKWLVEHQNNSPLYVRNS